MRDGRWDLRNGKYMGDVECRVRTSDVSSESLGRGDGHGRWVMVVHGR